MKNWISIAWLFGCPAWSLWAATNNTAQEWFDARHLTEIRLTMALPDWEAMRHEHRDLLAELGPTRFDQASPKPYRTYRAELVVDGVAVGAVGIRKRGFLGSSSFQRPSLGLRLDEFDPNGQISGLQRLALNNNLQDASQVHQVLAYHVFAAAGVPAPRCKLVRVTLNEMDLGLYSNVEAVEDDFLARHFGDASGNLYEGLASDFRPRWVNTFERKNHKHRPSRSDLDAVVQALQCPDEQFLARLEPVLNLEAYFTFWAVETLIGHWDSYSNNGNNFFVYRHPVSRRFLFIPWGTDSVLGDPDPFAPGPMPESVRAMSLLPRRLYMLAETRERYRERLRWVLKTAWHESELLAEVDRLEMLLKPHVTRPQTFQEGLANVRRFIRQRRAALEAELNGPAPEWKYPLRQSGCLVNKGSLAAEFNATWPESPADTHLQGAATMTLTLDGQPRKLLSSTAKVGPATDQRNFGFPTISLLALESDFQRLQIPMLVIQPEQFQTNAALKVDGFNVGGFLLESILGTNQSGAKFNGMLIGTLQLQAAGSQPGDKVMGRVRAEIYQMSP